MFYEKNTAYNGIKLNYTQAYTTRTIEMQDSSEV